MLRFLRAAPRGAFFVFGLLLCATSHADDLVFTPAPATAHPGSGVLLDVTAAGDRLIVVGASGLIALSDDSGRTWRQAEVPVSATLTAVDFPTPEKGWAVGHAGVILHSADGGETWQLQSDGRRTSEALVAYAGEVRRGLEAQLELLDTMEEAPAAEREDLEYALEDAIFLEEDAQLAVETGPADPLLAVRFIDEQRGFAAGAYGAFLRTVDGGETWELALAGLENPDRFHYYSVLVAQDGAVYLAGEAGLLFRSTDGGVTFERFWDVYEGSLFGLVQSGEGVLAFGLRGNLFRYDAGDGAGEGGWESLVSSNDVSLYGGTVLPDGAALLVGAGGRLLRRAADGSEGLESHSSRSTLSSAAAAPDGVVWLVGMDGLLRADEEAAQ